MVWFDANYGYKKKITIDNAKVAGDEVDFPVLISVIDADLADEANGGHVKSANGYDIIFTNGAENTQLKHEIEKYTNTNGTLVYWVKVPSLSSTPPSTDIYIYYGKAGVGADPSTTDTWDANFKAVYHYKESAGNFMDSTADNNDGTFHAGVPNPQPGKIGDGQRLDGTDDYITVPDSVAWDIDDDFTLEFWIKHTDHAGTEYYFTHWESHAERWFFIHVHGNGLRFTGRTGAANVIQIQYVVEISDSNWHYVELTRTGNDWAMFVDRGAAGIDTYDFVNTFAADLYIARDNDAVPGNFFYGEMDETRFSNKYRSINWRITTHENQNDPAGFLGWGAEEEGAVGVGANIFYYDGVDNIELQRDDASPVQMWNGANVIGLKLGATDDANASPFHVFDGTTIKAILKMP